jgi:hypothetical protein
MCPDVEEPCGSIRSGRNDLGGEQTWRPERYEISAASKCYLREVVIRRSYAGSRPMFPWGRPMTPWKKQARAHGVPPG